MESAIYLPVVLGLAAALFFAVSNALIRAGITDSSPMLALLYSLTANVVVLWPIVLFFYDVQFDLWAWRYFIVAGTLAPVLGRFFNYSGIKTLGINLSTPITYTNPLVSVTLAVLFLGEHLLMLGYVGVLLIFGGSVLLGTVRGGSGKEDSESDEVGVDAAGGDDTTGATATDGGFSFKKRHLIFPVLASLFYGSSHVFREMGISLVSSPVLATAVTITTSWVWMLIYLGIRRDDYDLNITRREQTFFVLSGLATATAIPLLYSALQIGTVAVVIPMTNTTPFWILLLSFIFFRGEELFTPRVIGGTTLTAVGVILLSAFGTVG